MIEVYNYGPYTISMATIKDKDIVVDLLLKQFLNPDASANHVFRKTKKYNMIAKSALTRQKTIIIKYKNNIAGMCTFYDLDKRKAIEYLTILQEYRHTMAIGCLMNYMLNHLFKDEKVYFHSVHEDFKNVSTKVKHSSNYVLNDEVATKLSRLFKDS